MQLPCIAADEGTGWWRKQNQIAECRSGPLSFDACIERRFGRFEPARHPPAQGNYQETRRMRFLSMVKVNENSGMQPSEQLMADVGKLIDEMTKSGVLLETAGLRPTAEAARVRLAQGKLKVIDGPFTEAKEVVGGYALLRAESMQEAIEYTERFLKVHGDAWEVECEVRQLDEGSAPKP
jgi:hypothetical protein